MQTHTHAVGIDLGTTYSCIAYLNQQGEPVTLANQEGELSTPSAVLIEDGRPTVGTKALKNAILQPEKVVMNSKRYIGDPTRKWSIDGKDYTPVDIATFILKKLLSAAQSQIGQVDQAVITVPAQFSDAQRHATLEAGYRAGLQQVDIINEPVAAALCYVLGTEGLWFSEVANEQRILVYDLGGGTFDLSLVRYQKDEVCVIKSDGDLELGGIDWTNTLVDAIAGQFTKEFGVDPRENLMALQTLTLAAEQTKRSLTVRERDGLTCQVGPHRKTYQILREQFERKSEHLLDRTAKITEDMLRDEAGKVRWAKVDVVLTTGGSSRMPMIKNRLKEMSGTTLNTSLSPDQSIAHGATYYAGMLISNDKFARSLLSKDAEQRLAGIRQQSVNARALGILVRDMKANQRVPHYLIPANTPLPTDITQTYGTVVENQKRVHLQIVESGTSATAPVAVLGECIIDDLPPNLPEGSEIAVTISYDAQARVHVSARDVTSGKQASAEIIRQENVVNQLAAQEEPKPEAGLALKPGNAPAPQRTPQHDRQAAAPSAQKVATPKPTPAPRATTPAQPKAVPVAQPAQPKAAPVPAPSPTPKPRATQATPAPKPRPAPTPKPRAVPRPGSLESADQPVPLCNKCGEVLDAHGRCKDCNATSQPKKRPRPTQTQSRPQSSGQPRKKTVAQKATRPKPAPAPKPRAVALPPINDDDILELEEATPTTNPPPQRKKVVKKVVKKKRPN